MSTDGAAILAFLRRAARRRTFRLVVTGAVGGLVVALLLLITSWLGMLGGGDAVSGGGLAVVAGAWAGWWHARGTRRRIAHYVEARAPHCRNLLVTAAELLAVAAPSEAGRWTTAPREQAPPPPPAIVRLVEARANELVSEIDAAVLFSPRRAAALLVVGLVVWSGLISAVPARPLDAPDVPVTEPVADITPVLQGVEVTVTPPPYTGRAPVTLSDLTRLEVIAGSRLALDVRAVATEIEMSTLEGAALLETSADGGYHGELLAEADGFVALEPRVDGRAGTRRLIGLVVVPDVPPRVRFTEPGRDLFLPQAGAPIPLVATAQDDFGLAELRVTYTIVSGSGETFEFSEGELPVRITRDDELSWSGAAELDPAGLGLSLGDMVVYRALARDRRPGAEAVESDAFVVEIVGRDAAISGGFSVEDEEERDALSQRMIIIKTERLLAQRNALGTADYAAEARRIAAEQRLVRAEFVFMMGGEIVDEVEEAEHEHEVAAGRLELRGRMEMTRAVELMSRAAAALTGADLHAALPLENDALEALQGALARSRYILRTMSDRESIDLLRRLTGEPGLARADRAAIEALPDEQLLALRRLLADIATLSARQAGTSGEPAEAAAADGSPGALSAELSDLAEAVLRVDPSSAVLQQVAADLAAAAAGGAEAADHLELALQALRVHVDERLPLAPAPPTVDPGLAGALVDELEARGGGR
jgi:hypothetical protein